MISSFATPRPTTDGSREQPPTSGINPIRVSTSPATASSAIVRMSAASASSIAPPIAAPWICAIVGLSISSSLLYISTSGVRYSRRSAESSDRLRRSPTSIPDENMGPSPRSTTTRTEGSSAASRKASSSPWSSSRLSAFRFSARSMTM